MLLNNQVVTLGELETFTYVCPFCHKGFETQGYRSMQNKRMTCAVCQAHYDMKVEENFVLDDASLKTARKIGAMPIGEKKKERLELWQQLADSTTTLKTRLRWLEMLRVAKCSAVGVDDGARRSRF
jgi:hypothetical protein